MANSSNVASVAIVIIVVLAVFAFYFLVVEPEDADIELDLPDVDINRSIEPLDFPPGGARTSPPAAHGPAAAA